MVSSRNLSEWLAREAFEDRVGCASVILLFALAILSVWFGVF
jgi:hypothetical protein